MHKSAENVPIEERIEQSKKRDASVLDYSSYIPVGNAVKKLKTWISQGAEIMYLSSHEDIESVEKDVQVLKKYNFPEAEVFFRQNMERYEDIAERLLPDVLIEDNCESIGGEKK